MTNPADDVQPKEAATPVNCKDCEKWQEHGALHICGNFSSFDLPGLCKNITFVTRPDDYCSFGITKVQTETEKEDKK